jgi:hypothetical protein
VSVRHRLRGAGALLACVLVPGVAAAQAAGGADFRFSAARAGITLLGLLIFGCGVLYARGLSARAARTRLAAIGALGVIAFASYYQFFALVGPGGFATTDNYHYYVGSKYFDELGYYGLYECSLQVLHERGVTSPTPNLKARDLHTMNVLPDGWVRAKGRDCPRRFGPERWRAFGDDVAFFTRRWPPHIWRAAWLDHGYHPTPVWTLIGGAVAGYAPTSSRTMMMALSRIDRFVVAASLLALFWAFGVEVAGLAAICWGTGFLWRYGWVGDAFLRHTWWAAAVLGLCLLRRGRPALGAAMLTLSASLRLFPGALLLGYGLYAGRRIWSERRIAPALARFALGGLCTVAGLAGLVAFTSESGLSTFADFVTKIGSFADLPATNKMGLASLARALFPESPLAAGGLRLAAVMAFAPLFWRGLARAEDWEAAALGATWIPFLTDPTNYYFSFSVLAAVLALHRPRVGVALLSTVLAWSLNGLLLYRSYTEFPVAAAIGIVSSFAVAFEMGRPRSREDRAERDAKLRTPNSRHGELAVDHPNP